MTNEPYTQPDYAHDPNDTLMIVPNDDPLDETIRGGVTHDDARDYAQLMSDLADERRVRVEIQTECDKYKRMTRTLTNLVDTLAIEIVGVNSGDVSMEGLVMHAMSILSSDDDVNNGGNIP